MPVHHVDVTNVSLTLPDGPAAPGSALWVEIRPDLKRSAVIASDILAALGKRRDVGGVGRNANADIDLAVAWMRAYDITALVAVEAQRLTPLLLRQVATIASRTGVPLWLLHRPPREDVFLNSLVRHHAHPRHLDEVPSFSIEASRASGRPTLGVTLPDHSFERFVSAVNGALPKTQAKKVLRRHAQTAGDAFTYLERDGCDIETITRLVERVLNTAALDDLLVTDIRGIQLAAWHHDHYLKVDVAALLASPERQVLDPTAVDQALTAYRQPHRAIAVALSAQQVSVTDIAAIRIGDVDLANGRVVTRAGRPYLLQPHTTRALNAQVLLREMTHAGTDAPLLNVADRAISQALNDAALHLGIRVHGRRAERHAHPRRWLKRLGITVQELQ